MRKKALIGVAIIAALALIGPVGSASAATYKVAVKYTILNPGPQKVTSAKFSGKPFGKGKITQTEVGGGVYTQVWKAKGGTFTVKVEGAQVGAKIVGAWKVLSGTGKYKRIKGGGKLSGSGIDFKLTGKVKY